MSRIGIIIGLRVRGNGLACNKNLLQRVCGNSSAAYSLVCSDSGLRRYRFRNLSKANSVERTFSRLIQIQDSAITTKVRYIVAGSNSAPVFEGRPIGDDSII